MNQKLTVGVIFKVIVFLVFFPISLFFVWPRQMFTLVALWFAAIGVGVLLMMPAETEMVAAPVPAKMHTFGPLPGVAVDYRGAK